jgi:AcrR family transcriptional regulator
VLLWARPEPGSRRPRFSRQQIARLAIEIADGEGFEAVSMRRLAAELGAGTMSLYHYVANKDELVALMDDALMGEALVRESELPSGWRDALSEVARHTRAVLLRHPWAVLAFQNSQFGPNALRHFEQSLAAVAGTGLEPAAKFELLTLVDDYVVGNVVHTTEARKRAGVAEADPELVRAATEFGVALVQSGGFPHTAAMFAGTKAAGGSAPAPGPALDERALEEQFERGLQAVLDGAGLRMAIEVPESGARNDPGAKSPLRAKKTPTNLARGQVKTRPK